MIRMASINSIDDDFMKLKWMPPELIKINFKSGIFDVVEGKNVWLKKGKAVKEEINGNKSKRVNEEK
jgi:hypothetical protein